MTLQCIELNFKRRGGLTLLTIFYKLFTELFLKLNLLLKPFSRKLQNSNKRGTQRCCNSCNRANSCNDLS